MNSKSLNPKNYNPKHYDSDDEIFTNNDVCIGPCVPPGTVILHPITLKMITNHTYSFCPVIPIVVNDNELQDIRKCYKFDDIDTIKNFDMITPKTGFTSERFLQVVYNIHSIENAIEWLNDNKHKPLLTKNRIINCAWKSYLNNIENVTEPLIHFYRNRIIDLWLEEIYDVVGENLDISGNTIIVNKNGKSKVTDFVSEKNKYIINNILTFNTIQKIILKFIKHNTEIWNSIDKHEIIFKKTLFEYIHHKIVE